MVAAEHLWYLSSKAYHSGNRPAAVLLKTITFLVYKAILCYQCEIEDDLELVHFGFGCAIHPNVRIGRRVKIFHHVTIAAETSERSASPIVIEDDCVIGAYAIILGNNRGGIVIGKGAVIAAGAIVNRDVPPGATMVPMPARAVPPGKTYA